MEKEQKKIFCYLIEKKKCNNKSGENNNYGKIFKS